MDLPDCPPGAEGYEDSVVEVPKKPGPEEAECTKAEKEFQDHLNSLKIKVEDGGARCMVDRRGRDISGKWIYLCYPCAAVCSGESILQTHISGKKHKTKLSMKTVWPQSIFDEHPYVLSEKGLPKEKDKDGGAEAEKVLKKMAEEVSLYNKPASAFDEKYNKYRNVRCHIQDTLDNIKTPLVGVEYLVEHPPEQPHHEPRYICTLCVKQGHPRTIINHMTCFWHRYNYLTRHFTAATSLLSEYRAQPKYREGVTMVINRLTQRIEEKYGRLKPVNIDLDEYERDTDQIHQWICKSYHFSEKDGPSFEEVVDTDLIKTLGEGKRFDSRDKRDPSPPVVAAPTKPLFNNYTRPAGRQERRQSVDGLSDISDEPDPRRRDTHVRPNAAYRFEPYHKEPVERTHRYTNKSKASAEKNSDKQKPANYEYKQKLAMGQRLQVEEAAKKTLAYHEKNPEKHPLYPEEWKKFWNRRYKEIQSEGKDPSKHDFKPEWIVYWTARMKQLHEEEVRLIVSEIYRKLCLPPPDEAKPEPEPERRREEPRRQPEPRRRIGRSPDPRRRSPPRRSPPRRRSPDLRRRSPPRHSPPRRSPPRRSPPRRSPPRHSPPRRSPPRHSPPRRRSPPRRSPPRDQFRWRKDDDRTRRDYRSPGSRGPEPPRHERHRSRSPVHSRTRSPPRTHIEIESVRRSRSPLSRRDDPAPLRNRSPRPAPPPLAPSLQTVLISDDELRPDDGLSPWNSDNDSLGSLPEARSPRGSRAGSEMSRASRPRRDHAPLARPAHPADLGPPENIVATLRLLVALEDYLGSLGPKIVDLLTEALKMEKEKANSSEELLEREASVALVETAKEKLKGAVQAGLVPPAAAPAVRAAVVRAAATLHAADTRQPQHKPQKPAGGAAAVPVAGVGEVDRAQIAQQMAAALIAQGKTDVSSEELAQLVDAVVGMAEAKKKEAEVKRKVEARAAERASRPPPPPPAHGKTASALQMLQSAYDENEKRIEKEDAPDAMDGLSDSDLETLLKNFNELSAEEQHSLIAYLKKLEAREPQRVEKLRQYVSAADDAPAPASAPAPAQASAPAPVAPVTIDSDDDDYTVEEVFQSATQKVKEDQIRQEMEIVKKSLEESKAAPAPAPAAKPDAARGTSAASDLFALVQASLQSVSGASSTAPIDVVTSHTAPRSFGDAPEPAPAPTPAPALTQAPAHPLMAFLAAHTQQQQPDAPQPVWTPRGDEPPPAATNPSFDQDTRGSYDQQSYGQDRGPYGTDSRDGFQDTRGPLLQDGRGPFAPDNRGPPPQRPFDQDGRGPFNQDGGRPYGQDNRGNFAPDGGRPPLLPNAPGMGMQGGRYPMQNNRGPLLPDNRGPPMQDNRGPPMQDNRGPHMQDNRGGYNMPDNRSGPGFNNYGQDNNQYNRGNNFMNGRQDMGQDQQQQPQHQYQQKNFRGRGGRGNFGGHMRGRGRGNYY